MLGGLGVAVLSTSQGLMTDREARKRQRRRRSPLLRLVGARHVPNRTSTHPRPRAASTSTIAGPHVTVKGPKGTLERDIPGDDHRPPGRRRRSSSSGPTTSAQNRALHGLTRSLVNNMVVGVSEGFTQGARDRRRRLPRHRPGPDKLELALGFCHPVVGRGARRASPSRCPQPTRIVVRGHRQGARRPGRRRHPQDPQARALQGQGHPLRRRARPSARPARQAK